MAIAGKPRPIVAIRICILLVIPVVLISYWAPPHRPSRCSARKSRSVSTKPWPSRAAQPDSQLEAGSAPMKENSPLHGSVWSSSGIAPSALSNLLA